MDTARIPAGVEALQAIARTAAALDRELARALDRLADAREVIGRLQPVAHDIRTLSRALDNIGRVLPVLMQVPVAGAIANLLSRAIKVAKPVLRSVQISVTRLDRSTVAPLSGALNDIDAGVTRIKAVMARIPDDCRVFATGLQVAAALRDLVEPLAESAAPDGSMTALARSLATLEEDVAGATEAVAGTLRKISETVDKLETLADTLGGLDLGALDTVREGIATVNGVLSPVYTAIQEVLGAIAPLRWALDAVAWVADHVVTPVVDVVLRATGLETLLEKLRAELATVLRPVTRVVDQVGKRLEKLPLGELQQALGAAAADALQADWGKISARLAEYRPGRDGSYRAALLAALDLVVPDGPLPPWPSAHASIPEAA